MISKQQLILIHTAKRQIQKLDENFDDAAYRTVLRSIAHVESSKDLDNKSFEQVMAWFESVGFKHAQRSQRSQRAASVSDPAPAPPASDPASNPASAPPASNPASSDTYWQSKADRAAKHEITDREIRMIEQLATEIAFLKPDFILPGFIRRMTRARTDDIQLLTATESHNLIEGLKSILTRELDTVLPVPSPAESQTMNQTLLPQPESQL